MNFNESGCANNRGSTIIRQTTTPTRQYPALQAHGNTDSICVLLHAVGNKQCKLERTCMARNLTFPLISQNGCFLRFFCLLHNEYGQIKCTQTESESRAIADYSI